MISENNNLSTDEIAMIYIISTCILHA